MTGRHCPAVNFNETESRDFWVTNLIVIQYSSKSFIQILWFRNHADHDLCVFPQTAPLSCPPITWTKPKYWVTASPSWSGEGWSVAAPRSTWKTSWVKATTSPSPGRYLSSQTSKHICNNPESHAQSGCASLAYISGRERSQDGARNAV